MNEKVTAENITSNASHEEFEEVSNKLCYTQEEKFERVKIMYQIKELRHQARINRYLVFATWVLTIATIATVIIAVIPKILKCN